MSPKRAWIFILIIIFTAEKAVSDPSLSGDCHCHADQVTIAVLFLDNGKRVDNVAMLKIEGKTNHVPYYWFLVKDLPYNGVTRSRHTIGLGGWTTYTFRVTAVDTRGQAITSKVLEGPACECTTPMTQPFSNPKNVTIFDGVPNYLIIRWKKMLKNQWNGDGFHYIITYKHNKTGIVQSETAAFDDEEIRIADPKFYQPYTVQVWSINSVGLSERSPAMIDGYSGEGVPQSIPKRFRIISDKTTENKYASFKWETVDTSESAMRGEFTGYKIRVWKKNDRQEYDKNFTVKRSVPVHEWDKRRWDVATVGPLPGDTMFHSYIVSLNKYFESGTSNVLEFTKADPKGEEEGDDVEGGAENNSAHVFLTFALPIATVLYCRL